MTEPEIGDQFWSPDGSKGEMVVDTHGALLTTISLLPPIPMGATSVSVKQYSWIEFEDQFETWSKKEK